MAPQFTVTSGPPERVLRWWTVRARSSLPVPFSPVTSTGRSVGATRSARRTASRNDGLWPIMAPSGRAFASDDWRASTWRSRAWRARARSTTMSRTSGSTGLVRKS